MEVFDLLTAKDIDIIDKYVAEYGNYGSDYLTNHADIKDILHFWNGAKSGFLAKLLNNQLILERKIDIATPESIIWKNIEDTIYPNGRAIAFIQSFYHWANTLHYSIYELVTELIEIDSLTTNIYDRDSFEISIPGKAHPLQINKGCKVAKILGKIAKEFNLDGYEEFRLKHSMALNQKRFQGTLCLSIHPMDYMTMSDNDCNWDSCMSWQKPGEYREGTVEMMNSPYVLVAYLKAEKDMELFGGDYTWNNKRWRELFVASPDIISGIKGYPYCDGVLEKETFKWLMELVKTNCSWCQYDPPIEYEADEPFEYHGTHVSIHYIFHIMYDDFYGKHTGYFSPTLLDKRDNYGRYSITLSGENVCMACGCTWEDYSEWDTQSLVCPDCTGEIKCNQCGDFLPEGESIEMPDGSHLCLYCADVYARSCNRCGSIHYVDDSKRIYLEHEGEIYLDEYFDICEDCLNDTEDTTDYYGPVYEKPYPNKPFYWGNIRVLNTDEMTLNGFNAFGFYGRTVEEARSLV